MRAEFDGLSPDWIHLASFLFVSHPRALRAEIERFRAALDTDAYWVEEAVYDGRHGQPFERAREALAAYAGGRPEEIAFTSNTTSALAMAYQGLRIRPDQEILTTEHDHFSHHMSIAYAAARSGAAVRRIALWERPAAADAGEIVARIERALSPRTRALGVTWVQSSTGVKLPVAAIAEAVARANRGRAEADRCLLIVDAVHGFGNQDVDVARLGADFVAAGGHKWLFGPRGTGFLWGRKESLARAAADGAELRPPGDGALERLDGGEDPGRDRGLLGSPGGFLAYEHFFALPAATEFHRAIGRDRIAARVVFVVELVLCFFHYHLCSNCCML